MSREGAGGHKGELRGGELKCYRHADRPSDEAGSRGVFAPKNRIKAIC